MVIISEDYLDQHRAEVDKLYGRKRKRKHLGPDDHPSGSPQSVHGSGGGGDTGDTADDGSTGVSNEMRNLRAYAIAHFIEDGKLKPFEEIYPEFDGSTLFSPYAEDWEYLESVLNGDDNERDAAKIARIVSRHKQWMHVIENPLTSEMILSQQSIMKKVDAVAKDTRLKEAEEAYSHLTETKWWEAHQEHMQDENGNDRKFASADEMREVRKKFNSDPRVVETKAAQDKLNRLRNQIGDHLFTESKATIESTIQTRLGGKSKYEKKVIEKAKEAEEFISNLVNTDHFTELSGKVEFSYNPEDNFSRANYSHVIDRITVGRFSSTDSYVHEIGHHLEHTNPAVQRRANEFLDMRIKRSNSESTNMTEFNSEFSKFRDDEVGNEDSFDGFRTGARRAYAGKRYDDGATEIVSMGLEQLYSRAGHFAKNDPEYVAFVAGVLSGELLGSEQ
jgi:hypothetical protein